MHHARVQQMRYLVSSWQQGGVCTYWQNQLSRTKTILVSLQFTQIRLNTLNILKASIHEDVCMYTHFREGTLVAHPLPSRHVRAHRRRALARVHGWGARARPWPACTRARPSSARKRAPRPYPASTPRPYPARTRARPQPGRTQASSYPARTGAHPRASVPGPHPRASTAGTDRP